MKKTRFLKFLIVIFSIAMLLICGIACRGQKGQMKQPAESFSIQFNASSLREEGVVGVKVLHHSGTESRMYLYTEQDTFGEPIKIRLKDIRDVFGVSMSSQFYQVKNSPDGMTVEETTTLTWDYEMYRYNGDNDLYHAYSIRIVWEITIDLQEDPPEHEHTWVQERYVAPTCEAQGYTVNSCSCGLEETLYENPTGHDWGAWQSQNDGVYHSRVCKTDSTHIQKNVRCYGGEATCLKKAVCTECRQEYGLYAKHKYDQYHVCIYCGDGEASISLKFSLSDDKTYYIAKGREFSKEEQKNLGAKLETVNVPAQYNGKPVKEIAEEGFIYNEVIKTLIISEGVEKIGRTAFNGCTNLERISLPDSLTYVGVGAFDDTAYAKNEENWSDGVLYVGNWLVSIKNTSKGAYSVKEGTVGIVSGVFISSNFSEIHFPDSVEYLDTTVNNFTRLQTKISFGAGVRTIGGRMFTPNNQLKVEITISEDNPYIKVQDNFILSKDGKTLFWHFGEFSEITIPDGVEKIEKYALAYRGDIRKVHIPESVVEICDAAFYNCYGLWEIVIPDNVRVIGDNAFGACASVISISIGAGLQEMAENALQLQSGDVVSITLSEGNTALLLDDGALYTADGKTLLLYPSNDSRTSFSVREGTETLPTYAIYKAENLKEIILPNSLKTVKTFAVAYCYMIRNLVIPDSVQTIEENAFYSCLGLISVKLGSGLQTVDSNAFHYAYRLVYVYNTSSLKLDDFRVNFTNGAYVTVPVYNDLSGVKLSTDENGFTTYAEGDEVILIDYMGEETDVVIPDGVTRIGHRAFHYNTSSVLLLSVTLPDSVKVIEEYAFYGHYKLRRVACGTGLKEIHEKAFSDCSKLGNFTLNSELERIGYDAFGYTPYDPSYDSDPTIDGRYLENYFLRPAYSAKSFIIHEGTLVLADASICVVAGYGYEYDWVVIPTSVVSIGVKDNYYTSPPKAIYYMGTQAQWLNVKNIQVVSSSAMYYYSQTYAENGWRYVNGVPTTWLEDGTQYEEISKVVLMTSDGVSGKVIVTRGQEIQLVTKIYPDFYQSITDVTYKVLEDESTLRDDKFIGILDESTGVLKITYDKFRAYNQIKIVAIADGMESNVLTFEMETVPVTSLQFTPNVTYVYARPGETLRLHAGVNQDATDMGVSFTLDEAGQKYATMTVNAGTATLTITEDFDEWAEHINLIARAEGGITAVQTIIILQEDFYLLLNGKIEDVYLYADESMYLTAEDGEGNAISLANVTLKIYDEDWNETDDLTVGANGKLIFKESVRENVKYTFEALYGEMFSYIFLEVMIRPSDVFVGVAHPTVKAGAYIDLNIIADPFPFIEQKEVYIAWRNYGIVEVVDRDTIYVLPTAQVGDSVIIYIEWKNAYGITSLMRYYTIRIEE